MRISTESRRRRARELAFRIAYQSDLMAESPAETWSRQRDLEGARLDDDQRQLVEDVVRVLEGRGADVDAALRAATEHWEVERLAATDRSVLRAALAELIGRPGIPARVILNEAIEIAKRYGSQDSGRFVNGVLDRAARTLRPGEL